MKLRNLFLSLLTIFSLQQGFSQDCNIFEIEAEIFCEGPDIFFVVLDFEYENVGNSGFTVQGNGVNYGSFSYDDLPLFLDNVFDANTSQEWEFVIIDNESGACSNFVEVGEVICNNGTDCQITFLQFDFTDCDADNTFDLEIDLEVSEPGNDFFDLIVDGQLHGFYAIADLPLTIENFDTGGNSNPNLQVCINDNPNCCADITVQAPNCDGGDCQITGIELAPSDCSADGTYDLAVVLEVENGINFVDVFVDDEFYGFFEMNANGEFIIENFEDGGNPVPQMQFCINDFPDCCIFQEFPAPDCNSTDCEIDITFVEFLDCDANGNFFVQIGVEVANPSAGSFNVLGNGQNYGNFPYGEAFYEIGPFEGNGMSVYELIVQDEGNTDCITETGFEAVNCNATDCEIDIPVFELTDCDGDGNFFVHIEVEVANPGAGSFNVLGNGQNYGNFPYGETFYEIGPFEGDGTSVYELIVQDEEIADCIAFIEFVAPNCSSGGDCMIANIELSPSDCDANGTYDLMVALEIQNGFNFVDVFLDGDFYGFFEVNADGIFIIENFEDGGNPVPQLEFCVNDIPDCCIFQEFPVPDCNGENLVWPGDMNNDNIAHNVDLLYFGIAFNTEGPDRLLQGIEWSAVEAENWDEFFENGVNYAFADADGSGNVGVTDFSAIDINYGLTHGDVEVDYDAEGDEDDPEFFVDLPAANDITLGQPFTAPIILGTEDMQVEDIYGIAFTLTFDPDIIDPASIEIAYDNSWMGTVLTNAYSIDRTFGNEGKVEVALTRIDQNNVSGFGQIAAFIGVIDNIAGKHEVEIGIEDVRAINNEEAIVYLQRPVEMIEITVSTNAAFANNSVKIFPNPASDYLVIDYDKVLDVSSVLIKNVEGKTVLNSTQNIYQIDINGLSSGG